MHIKDLRTRQFQHHMLVDAIKEGFAHLPGIARSLGMSRREVEEQIEAYERRVPVRQSRLVLNAWVESSSSDDESSGLLFGSTRNRRGPRSYSRPPYDQHVGLHLPRCSGCERAIDTDNLPVKCARCLIDKMCIGCGITTPDAGVTDSSVLFPACQSCRRKKSRSDELFARATRMRRHYAMEHVRAQQEENHNYGGSSSSTQRFDA